MVTLDTATGQVYVSPSVNADVGTYSIVFRMTIGAITRDSTFVLTVPDVLPVIIAAFIPD
jgi:hypothetical protein